MKLKSAEDELRGFSLREGAPLQSGGSALKQSLFCFAIVILQYIT